MKLRNEFLVLVLAAALVGCSHGQAPVTPPPTVTVSNNAPACPTGYTCGYIYRESAVKPLPSGMGI
jgi:hypothetical protein